MAIAHNISVGNTGTSTSSTANLNHAANAMILIAVSYKGTTSPSSVKVGGVTATYLASSKISQSTNNSVELWYIYRTGAANEAVLVTFAGSTRHAWSASAYTGVAPNTTFEGLATTSGSGSSVRTSLINVAIGTAGRMLINADGSMAGSNGSGSIVIAPNNSETERDERDLAGSSTTQSVSVQIQEYSSAAARDLKATHTKAGRTIRWATIGVALLPPITVNSDSNIELSGVDISNSDRGIETEGNYVWRIERSVDGGPWVAIETGINIGESGGVFTYDDNVSLEDGKNYCYRVRNLTDDSNWSNTDCDIFIFPNSDRELELNGKSSLSSDREAELRGKETESGNSQIELSGKDSGQSDSIINIHGKDAGNSERDISVAGKEHSSGDVIIILHGKDSEFSNCEIELTGAPLSADSEIEIELHGESSEQESVEIELTGKESSLSEININIHGKSISQGEANVILHGKDSAQSDIQINIHGKDTSAGSANAELNGKNSAQGEIIIEISSEDEFNGDISIELSGKDYGLGERDLITCGKESASSDREIAIRGKSTEEGNRSISLRGKNSWSSDVLIDIYGALRSNSERGIEIKVILRNPYCPKNSPYSKKTSPYGQKTSPYKKVKKSLCP